MNRGPRELMLTVLDRIGSGKFTSLAELYADDVVVEHPQQYPCPVRTVGLAAQIEHWLHAERTDLGLSPRDVVVHQTIDPELVIAEFVYEGQVADTGRSYRSAHISVLQARDGKIIYARDCQDDLALVVARDRVPRLLAAIERAGAAPPPAAPAWGREPPTGPGAVLRRLVLGLVDGRCAGLEQMYADDATVTQVFLPSAAPLRGRSQIREYLAARAATATSLSHLVVHEGVNGKTAIADFGYSGISPAGKRFQVTELMAASVRDGLVTEAREYRDHVRLAFAEDGLTELVTRSGRGSRPCGPALPPGR